MDFKSLKSIVLSYLAQNTSVVFQRTPCGDWLALHTASGL